MSKFPSCCKFENFKLFHYGCSTFYKTIEECQIPKNSWTKCVCLTKPIIMTDYSIGMPTGIYSKTT